MQMKLSSRSLFLASVVALLGLEVACGTKGDSHNSPPGNQLPEQNQSQTHSLQIDALFLTDEPMKVWVVSKNNSDLSVTLTSCSAGWSKAEKCDSSGAPKSMSKKGFLENLRTSLELNGDTPSADALRALVAQRKSLVEEMSNLKPSPELDAHILQWGQMQKSIDSVDFWLQVSQWLDGGNGFLVDGRNPALSNAVRKSFDNSDIPKQGSSFAALCLEAAGNSALAYSFQLLRANVGVSATESCEALEKKASTVTELSIRADKRLTDLRPFAGATATSSLSFTITSCGPETLSNLDVLQGLKDLGALQIEVNFATPDDKKQSRCSNKTWLEKLAYGRVSGGFKSLVTLGVSFWATNSDDPSIQVIDFNFAKEFNSGQTNKLRTLMVGDLATSSFSGAEGLTGISTFQANATLVSDLSPLLPVQNVSLFGLDKNTAITSAKCPIDSVNVNINKACLAKFPR